MAYKIQTSRMHNLEDERIMRLERRYHHHPPFLQITKVGTENALGVTRRKHEKGTMLQWKNRFAVVEKVEDNGVFVKVFDKSTIQESTRIERVFLTNKQLDNETEPFFSEFLYVPFVTMK